MKIREYTDADYATISAWWICRNMPVIPAACLPPHGIIVEDDDGTAGSVFLYRDANVPLGWMAWIQVRPGINCFRAYEVLTHLTEATNELGRGLGLAVIQVQVQRNSLVKFLKGRKWIENHSGMLMYRILTA